MSGHLFVVHGDLARPSPAELRLTRDGAGLRSGRRAEVVDKLLARARRALSKGDVVVVVEDPRDLAAVRLRRTDADWAALPPALREEADRLGALAAAGGLSLYVGSAGPSPLGRALLDGLDVRERVDLPDPPADVLVRSMLLRSHVLHVGVGRADADVLALASEAAVVRGDCGTVLTLTTRDVGHPSLRVVPMSNGTDQVAAARVLEVFLDRMVWTAAFSSRELASAYLLDPAYDATLSEADRALKAALVGVAGRDGVTASSAWPEVATLLRRLGLEP